MKEAKEAIKAENWPIEYGTDLYHYAINRLGDANSAKDVVQETYMAGLKGSDRFDENGSMRRWLFGILKHKIVDQYRVHYREHVEDMEKIKGKLNKLPQEKIGKKHCLIAGQKPLPPFEAIKGKELQGICHEGLSQMSDPVAKTFKMYVIDGLSTEEISKRLSISKANVWVRIHRARKRLKSFIGKEWPLWEQ